MEIKLNYSNSYKSREILIDSISEDISKYVYNTDGDDSISIIGHVDPKPDGDAICSTIGLARIIKSVKSKTREDSKVNVIFACDATEYSKRVLEYIDRVDKTSLCEPESINIVFTSDQEKIKELIKKSSLFFVLDTDIARTGIPEEYFSEGRGPDDKFIMINIDHHEPKTGENSSDKVFKRIDQTLDENGCVMKSFITSILPKASSTSEIILGIYSSIIRGKMYGLIGFYPHDILPIASNIFKVLFGGMYTDSGKFYYSKFLSAIWQIGKFLENEKLGLEILDFDLESEFEPTQDMLDLLIDDKKDPNDIPQIMFVYSKTRVKELDNGKKIAILVVREEELSPSTKFKPIHLLQELNVAGCMQLTVFKDNRIKGELRSTLKEYRVVDMAKEIPGGGGHIQAAGFTTESVPESELEFKVKELTERFEKIFA